MSYGLLVLIKVVLLFAICISWGVTTNYENKVNCRGENRWRKLGQGDFYVLCKKGDPDCRVIIYSQFIGASCALALFILFGLVFAV